MSEKINIARKQVDEYKSKGLKVIVEQLKSCDYECIGGPMINNVAFIALEELAQQRLEPNDRPVR
jgi:hypothetical protein